MKRLLKFLAGPWRAKRLERIRFARARAAFYREYINCGDDYTKARRMAAVMMFMDW